MLVRDGEDDGSAAMEVHGQEERSCHDEYHSCQTHHGASLATVVARAARRIGAVGAPLAAQSDAPSRASRVRFLRGGRRVRPAIGSSAS